MTRALQCRQPRVFVMVSTDSGRVDEIADSVIRLAQVVTFFVILLTQLIQTINRIVEPVADGVEFVLDWCQECYEVYEECLNTCFHLVLSL